MSTATPTATQAATQASLPSRAAVRWYQLAVIVLGLALAAVTALAIYLAVNHSTATWDRPPRTRHRAALLAAAGPLLTAAATPWAAQALDASSQVR